MTSELVVKFGSLDTAAIDVQIFRILEGDRSYSGFTLLSNNMTIGTADIHKKYSLAPKSRGGGVCKFLKISLPVSIC